MDISKKKHVLDFKELANTPHIPHPNFRIRLGRNVVLHLQLGAEVRLSNA